MLDRLKYKTQVTKQRDFGVTLISALGILWGIILITKGTLNLFEPQLYGLTYNYYLLSILDLRLDVPSSILGFEAFYGYNGEAYCYYGLFPALLRLPFLLIPNFKSIDFSILFIVTFNTGTGIVALKTLLKILDTYSEETAITTLSWLSALLIWFASPVAILYCQGAIYNEVITIGLFFAICFASSILNDLLVKRNNIPSKFTLLAVLAAIELHCRPTLAFGMFFSICVFILLYIFDTFSHRGTTSGNCTQRGKWSTVLKKCLPPLTLLFVSGCILLLINWLRWGSITETAPITRYGFFLYDEGYSDRILGFVEQGRFNFRRIILGSLMNFFGVGPGFGEGIYNYLMQTFQTGWIRTETKFPMALAWWPWFLSLLALWPATKRMNASRKASFLVLLAGFLVPPVLILCYPTVTIRYKAEFMPLLLISYSAFLSLGYHKKKISFRWCLLIGICLFLSILLTTWSAVRNREYMAIQDLLKQIYSFI